MSAGKHVAVWPKVKVTVGEKRVVVTRGELLPDGVSAVDLENLTSFGAIAGATVRDSDVDSDSKPAKVEDILAEVGDDKEKAAVALEEEKAGKNRKTLVGPLEAILAKNDS